MILILKCYYTFSKKSHCSDTGNTERERASGELVVTEIMKHGRNENIVMINHVKNVIGLLLFSIILPLQFSQQ